VADEPTSMLDVSIRISIMELMSNLAKEMGVSYLYITHDLAVARYMCDRIAVMYLGKIVEVADADRIFEAPQHPYTQALISAVPMPDPEAESHRRRIILPGDPPSPLNPPPGCPFHPRCPVAVEQCMKWDPLFYPVVPGHVAACLKVGPGHGGEA
jgi:oligopeptide transport system ATP-binding protein